MQNSVHQTPSALWADAIKQDPIGSPWEGKQTTCLLCSADVSPGDLAQKADKKLINDSFNNKLDCHQPGEAVCGHCLALWNPQWMQKSSKSYAVAGCGAFMLATNEDIASFVLKPPQSDYVAIFNTRQQAHMIWKTPVAAKSNDYLQVRIDDEIMLIDRQRVLHGVTAWQTTQAILKKLGKPKSSAYLLSYSLKSPVVGAPIKIYCDMIQGHSEEGRAALDILNSLTIADWWALSGTRGVDLDVPESWPKPRPVAVNAIPTDSPADEGED